MRRVLATMWGLGLLGSASPVWAVGETATASRLARQALDAAQRPGVQKPLIVREAEVPVFEVRSGLAGDRAEDGTKVLSMPVALTYQPFEASPWILAVSGAAHTRITSPAAPPTEGLADVTFELTRSLPESFFATLGVTVPTGGEVGSTTARQTVALLRLGELGKGWSYVGLVALQRSNRLNQGLGRTAQTLYGRLHRDVGDGCTLYVSGARWYQRGAGGLTDLGLGYTFPVADKAGAALELTRGITRGARHTGVSLTLTFVF